MPRGLVSASIAAVTLMLSGCSPLSALNAIIPDEGYTTSDTIAYGPKPRQALNVYMPVERDGPAPVVVFFYGGSWKGGNREHYRFVAQSLTARGYVTVIPDYRVYPDVTFPAFVKDGASVLRWVHDEIAEYGGDPDQIYLMGHSAGAYITAQLSLDPRYLAGVGLSREVIEGMVGFAGPYAFHPLKYKSVRAIFADHPDREDLRPINFVDDGAPPMLLIHGGDDGTVVPANSRELAEKMKEAGATARYVEIPDSGHVGLLLALAKPFRSDGGAFDIAAAFIDDREQQVSAVIPAAVQDP
jgi:acetyl esterase/lipase